jgi:ABC-type multidrug transport system ATPase subunit
MLVYNSRVTVSYECSYLTYDDEYGNNVLYSFLQDDAAVVMGTLSVRENLHFSAALRLPSHTTWEQRKLRVEQVIKELGLSGCSDTKVKLMRAKC